tara:strand:+ start:274 stop:486 length:213 start_codon:yes stop_codon:yes gene_type:complete
MIMTNETEAERYRKELVVQANHIELLKRDMAEMSRAYYILVERNRKLIEERDNLKIQLNIQEYWEDPKIA